MSIESITSGLSSIALSDATKKSDSRSLLEELPVEIKLLVLDAIADVDSFTSLVQASETFRKLFESNQKRLLESILTKSIPKDVVPDALATYHASISEPPPPRNPPKPPDPNFLPPDRQFLVDYQTQRRTNSLTATFGVLSLRTADQIASLHGAVEFLTRDFINWMKEKTSTFQNHHIRFPEFLSESETCRIQRAFYRIEMFVALGRNKGSYMEGWRHNGRWEGHNHGEYPHPFCNVFAAWENEEMVCLREYMISRLSACFTTIEPWYSAEVTRVRGENFMNHLGNIDENYDFSSEGEFGYQCMYSIQLLHDFAG
jgi:hypothetical protein